MTENSDPSAPAVKPVKRRGRPRSHSENVKAAKQFLRCSEAFKLLCEGQTYDEIATALGWRSRQAVQDALKKYRERVAAHDVDLFRLKHIEQLRMMSEVNMANASAGDSFAIQNQIRIQEREAKLLGFDSPTKHEVTGKDGMPLGPQGVLVVPCVMSEEQWAAQAVPQQEELAKKESAAAGNAAAT